MQSLNFDDGLKSFAINGDEKRVIRFNPADPDLLVRYNKARMMLQDARTETLKNVKLDAHGQVQSDSEDELARGAQAMEDVNSLIRSALKMMFNSDVYDTVFAGQSPFSWVGDKFLFDAFMDSVKPVLEAGIAECQKASHERMARYTRGYLK